MSVRGWAACLLLGIVCAVLSRGIGWGETPGPASVRSSIAPVVRGAGSCSSTACHGSDVASIGPVLRNEATIWASRDRHAEAYRTLFTEQSRAIARLVSNGRAAHEDARCLACHATPRAGSAPRLQDGVGCEACHGPANAWLGPHTTYGWDQIPPLVKEERFGMVRTKDLARRAEVCAGCHVGAPARDGQPARDVDHDLIAAGHPRLTFELSAYLALMPAHWVEKGRNAESDFPARAWAIGQAVSARSALELLRERAHSATWPEFSEYDCASCHHEPRLAVPDPNPSRGTAAWGDWHYSLIGALPGLDPKPLEVLRGVMNEPNPPPEQAAAKAREAADLLGRWVGALRNDRFDPPRVAALIRSVETTRGPANADGDSQRYLALVPLRQALIGPARDEPGLLHSIDALRFRLNLTDSPRQRDTHP